MRRITYLCMIAAAVATVSGCGAKTNQRTDAAQTQASQIETEAQSEPLRADQVSTKQTEIPDLEIIYDADIVQEIKFMGFADAVSLGEAVKEEGEYKFCEMGNWYTVRIGDIEYYYILDLENDHELMYGYAIVGSGYELDCGIKVGMSEEEICKKYPNVAIMNFDNTYISEIRADNKGWRTDKYPASLLAHYDYVIVAKGVLTKSNNLDMYMGLLMKDKKVKAILFYASSAYWED